MKIGLALETTFDSNAGVQQYFKSIGRYFLSHGHDVQFLTPHSDGTGEFAGRITSMGTVFNPPLNTTSIPIGLHCPIKKVRSVLEEQQFDIIHVGVPVSPLSMGRLIRYARCPVVATYMIHTQSSIQKAALMFISHFPHHLRKHVDILIAPNEKTMKNAQETFGGTYTIIPHAINHAAFEKSEEKLRKFDDGMTNLLFLGRLEERKGVHLLLEAMPEVIQNHPRTRLIIAGDGPNRQDLETLSSSLRINKNVTFEGYVDEKDKGTYFASADLCVFPATHGECFGIVLIEALAAGKIPIAFDNEGYGSVLKNIPGALVENRNIQALSRKITYFISHPRDRRKLEQQCGKEAQRYDIETTGPQILDLYEKALKMHL